MTYMNKEEFCEFEIELFKEQLSTYNYDFDEYKRCSNRLIEVLELRIQQLKDKIKDINNEVTEH